MPGQGAWLSLAKGHELQSRLLQVLIIGIDDGNLRSSVVQQAPQPVRNERFPRMPPPSTTIRFITVQPCARKPAETKDDAHAGTGKWPRLGQCPVRADYGASGTEPLPGRRAARPVGRPG